MVLSMDRWVGKIAVVTGASGGCGASITSSLVKNGLIVIGLARNEDRLNELSKTLMGLKGKLIPFKVDITKEIDLISAFNWILDNYGPVSVLINNAGIAQPTTLIDGNINMWKNILNTNVIALSIATREAIKQMQQYKINGQIIHINSILGHYVAQVPNMNMYPPSKFAVTALTEVLRQELLKIQSNIRVTSISPGAIDTDFATSSNLLENQEFAQLYNTIPKLKAEDVGDAVIYVLSTPSHVQVQDIILRPLGEFV